MKKLVILILFVPFLASAQQPKKAEKQYVVVFNRQLLDSINKYATINSQVLSTSDWPSKKTFPIMQFILQIQQMFNQSYLEQSRVDTTKKPKK